MGVRVKRRDEDEPAACGIASAMQSQTQLSFKLVMVKFSLSLRILALTSWRARFQPPTRAIGQLGSSHSGASQE